MKSKISQKLKTSILSILTAVAMMFSANFSSIFALTNYATYASATESIYSAKTEKTFNFQSSDSLTTHTEGISNNYYVSRNAEILDAYNHVKNKVYFPIVKYNGFTALKSERDTLSSDELSKDEADNYYGVISTKDYQVAHKEYEDKLFESVKVTITENEGTGDIKTTVENRNVVYITVEKASDETDADYQTRLDNIQAVLNQINTEMVSTSSAELYKILDTSTDFYDSSDYSSISTDSDAYSAIEKDFEGKMLGTETFNVSDYKYSNKKIFEYQENKLYISTTSSISLTNNSYYVVSVWVYTAGDDTTATIAVTGTNFSAKIENISTNGLWVQYYLFIETKAIDSTNATISLYYGDDNGVTGSRSLQSYKDGVFPNNEDNYTTRLLTGTVAFDQLKIHQINQEEYINETINGHSIEDVAKAHLVSQYQEDITTIKNNKKATEHTEGEGSSATTTYDYDEVSYGSLSDLYKSASYSARYSMPSIGNGDGTFQTLNGKTNADLIYNFNDTAELDFDTYKDNEHNMFSYYMPRYSDGSSKTLTLAQKKAYRDRYNNTNLSSTYSAEEQAKYGYSQLWASVVAEKDEFKGYEKDKYDELGNLIEIDGENDEKVTDTIKDYHNNTFISSSNQDNYILKLENKSSYELGVTTSAIKVPVNAFYRVSVWVYSSDKDAVATAKLFSTLKERTTGELGTQLLTTATATEFEYNSNSTNGWKEISFVVKGNPHQDCEIYLSLIASANDTIYFDQIRVENISSSNYSSGSNSLDLSSKAVLTSNVTNGLFTNVKTDNADPMNTYPYSANSGWTVDSDVSDDSVINGIISTNEDAFEHLKVPAYNEDGEYDYYDQNYITYESGKYYYTKDGANQELIYNDNYLVDQAGNFVRATTLSEMFHTAKVPQTTINDILQGLGLPGYSEEDNEVLPDGNVYAVYLPEATEDDEENPSFLLKSNNMSSFSSGSVYKLTFQAWIADNFEGTLTAKLVYDSKTISDISINLSADSSITRNKWHTFTFYLRTGNTSRSGISLQLGAEESKGTLFFQNVNYTALSEKTSGNKTISVNEQFDSLINQYSTVDKQNGIESGNIKYVRFIDLNDNDFTMHSTEINEETNVYDSYSYTLASKDDDAEYTQGIVGVIKTSDNPAFKFNDADVAIGTNDNAPTDTALLLKNEATTDYTYVNSVFSNTLSSKKYYKVTFFVKTSDMGENGLTVIANGVSDDSKKFENINTSSYAENNGWKQYTMYISVGSSSISSFSLSFKLGTNDNESYTGWALVSAINVEEIDEDVYTEDTEKEEIKNDDSIVIKQLKVEETDDEEEEDKNEFSWATFFLVFSSLLLVVSLVVALVAVAVKRKAKKNPTDSASNGGIEDNNNQELGGIE